MTIDFSRLTAAASVRRGPRSEAADIEAEVGRAQDYLRAFKWCDGIAESYVGISEPGVVNVMLHHIVPAAAEVDEWLWTVTGDLPPAYLVTDDANTPEEALTRYIEEMAAWVDAARTSKPTDDLIPVNAPATPEYAEMLDARLRILRDNL